MQLLLQAKAFLRRHNALFSFIWPVYFLYRHSVMIFARIFSGINPNKVVFSSFFSKYYNDNPRYISEKLHELRPEAEIVWLFNKKAIDQTDVPSYVRKVQPISFKGLVEQATAKIWIDNVKKSEALSIGRDQIYINTWHGDRGFKRVGADNGKQNIRNLERLERKCSLMVAGSLFGENTYRTAFHYQGDVMLEGCPRNDLLLNPNPEICARVKKAFKIEDGTKVLIYAPTYRDINDKSYKCTIDLERTLNCFEEATGYKWICLFRAHYLSHGMKINEMGSRFIDATQWPEMAELLLVSDALISDYSSCVCDFTLLRRPAFLYISDIDDYVSKSRELYFDLDDSPFLLARNMDELENLIQETDDEAAQRNCISLDEFFGTRETGHACESVCKYIIGKMDKACGKT